MKITNRGRQTVTVELDWSDVQFFAKMAAQASGLAHEYDVTDDDAYQFQRLACFFGFIDEVLEQEGSLMIVDGHNRKFLPPHLRDQQPAA